MQQARQACLDELCRRLDQRPRLDFRDWPVLRGEAPTAGVYFFFERGERRPSGAPRVTRVGTHSRSGLRTRLRAHYGTLDGRGSHRASIFRSLVGEAIGEAPGSWGQPRRALKLSSPSAGSELRNLEKEHEEAVSNFIRGFQVTCISCADPEHRSRIEEGAIALLSNSVEPSEAPTLDWLGLRCPRPKVVASGLWNQNYVTRPWSPDFLALIPDLERAHA